MELFHKFTSYVENMPRFLLTSGSNLYFLMYTNNKNGYKNCLEIRQSRVHFHVTEHNCIVLEITGYARALVKDSLDFPMPTEKNYRIFLMDHRKTYPINISLTYNCQNNITQSELIHVEIQSKFCDPQQVDVLTLELNANKIQIII